MAELSVFCDDRGRRLGYNDLLWLNIALLLGLSWHRCRRGL